MIPGFFELIREEISLLQDAVSKKNYETIRHIGHKIKGSSLCYGFKEAGGICLNIEKAGDENAQIGKIRTLVSELADYIENVEVVYEQKSADTPGDDDLLENCLFDED